MTNALRISADKTITEVVVNGYRDGQAIVGGLIQPVDLTFGTMYVNECYKRECDTFNSIASDVCGLGGRGDLMLSGVLGDVYIVGPLDDEGYDTDVTEAAMRAVIRVARET